MNKLLIFTGAGISAPSGVKTYRDPDGVWSKNDVKRFCNITHYKTKAEYGSEERRKIFEFYNHCKSEVVSASPNFVHMKIAEWQKTYGQDRVKVVTMNVDNLLERAGVQDVVHVHGDMTSMQCLAFGHVWHIGNDSYDPEVRCPECQSRAVKPNVVFFGEYAPEYMKMNQIFKPGNRTQDDIVVYMGSSGEVLAPQVVVQTHKGHTCLVNKDPVEGPFKNRYIGDFADTLEKFDTEIIRQKMQ